MASTSEHREVHRGEPFVVVLQTEGGHALHWMPERDEASVEPVEMVRANISFDPQFPELGGTLEWRFTYTATRVGDRRLNFILKNPFRTDIVSTHEVQLTVVPEVGSATPRREGLG